MRRKLWRAGNSCPRKERGNPWRSKRWSKFRFGCGGISEQVKRRMSSKVSVAVSARVGTAALAERSSAVASGHSNSETALTSGRCRFLRGQGRVHSGIGADFVVVAVGPAQDGWIADIDLGDAVLADGDLAKYSIRDGNGADEELALVVDPWAIKPRLTPIWYPGRKRDFLAQFAERRLTQTNSAYVVVEAHFFGARIVIVLLIAPASDLNRVNPEDSSIGREFLANALTAGGETIALVDSVGNHDAVVAIHQVERGGILVGDAQAEFHLGQTGTLQQLVVVAEQAQNLPGQNAGAADADHGFAFALQQGHDNGVAFEKDLGGAVFREQLIDRLIKIKAEIRGGVHSLCHERAGEAGRIAHVGLEDDVVKDTILGGFLVFGRQKLVEHAVQRGELADFVVADQVDAVKTGAEGFQAAQVAVIANKVVEKPGGEAAALGAAAGGDASDGRKEAVGMETAFGNHSFDALGFFAEDQGVLDLLRIYAWGIFGQQRHGFIGSDDVGKGVFALQHTRPDVEAVFSISIFLGYIFAV